MRATRSRYRYAKTSPPRLDNFVPRERLFDRLDRLGRHPVTCICGPPGAGKTVLAASYVEARQRPALWFQADADDADPATFFYFLGEATARDGRRAKAPLPVLTPEFQADVPGFTRRFFREMFRDLPPPPLLVLDNFQEGGPALAGLMQEAISAIPPQARVILISRGEPESCFARQRANQTMGVLDWDDLRLTPDEALAIARAGHRLDDATVERLRSAADGWAAGFVLLLEYGRHVGADSALRLPESIPQVVFDYFAGELFATLTESGKRVLLRAAILPHCDADAACTLSGDAAAGAVLESLFRRRLFTERKMADAPVYQFHALFRQFLLSTAQEAIPAEERRDLRRRAAALMERRGEIESAATLYGEAQDWTSLARLATDHAGALLSQGRNQALEAIVGSLPPSVRESDPWLLFWRGAARIPVDPQQGRVYLGAAQSLFREQGDPHGRFLACGAVLETYFFEWADFAGEDPWIREMEELLRQHPDFLDPQIEARVLGAGLAVIYRDPSHPMLDEWARRGLAVLRDGRAASQFASIANFVVQYNLWRGRLRDTGNLLDELHKAVDPRHTPPVALLGLECWTSIHAWMTTDYSRAYDFVERALEIGRANGIRMLDALVIGQGVYAALGAGDLERTRRFLAQMEQALLPSRRLDWGFFLHLRFGCRMLGGDLTGAKADIEAALAIAEDAGSPFLASLNRIGLAILLMEQHQPERALSELDRVMTVAQAIPAQGIVFSALLLRAGLLLDRSQVAAALDVLRSALRLGSTNGYENTQPFWHPGLMSRLCAFALQEGVETGYVTGLIRRRNLRAPSNDVVAWPWPIRIFTLGRFALVRDGRANGAHGKAQKRQLELLKALIALGGREVESNRLADLLWPEAEGPAAGAALDMALHRLRKLLGQDDAITVGDGKLTLNPALCWVDVWAAERVLNDTERALANGPSRDALTGMTRRALELFQGQFLASEPDSSWILPTRERLRRKFLRQLAGVGRHWEESGCPDQAVELYQCALEQDPLAEEFYRRLMRTQSARGDGAEALNTYRRCRHLLSVVLGVAPSAETEAVRRSIEGDRADR